MSPGYIIYNFILIQPFYPLRPICIIDYGNFNTYCNYLSKVPLKIDFDWTILALLLCRFFILRVLLIPRVLLIARLRARQKFIFFFDEREARDKIFFLE